MATELRTLTEAIGNLTTGHNPRDPAVESIWSVFRMIFSSGPLSLGLLPVTRLPMVAVSVCSSVSIVCCDRCSRLLLLL